MDRGNRTRTVQCRKCTRCLQNGTDQKYGRGNWIVNDCVQCPIPSEGGMNPSLVSLLLLIAGFIVMSTWTLSQNTSNHRTANFFVMTKAKSKFMNKILKKRRAAQGEGANKAGGLGGLSAFGMSKTAPGMNDISKTKISFAGAVSDEKSAIKLAKKGFRVKLSRVEKIRAKKAADAAKILKDQQEGDMGTKNETSTVGSISMTKILMNHIHMMSMIPLFDSNFLTSMNKAFFNAVGSIFGLYTGSAFECYFNYKEMFPLAAQRGIFFLVSPFVVTFVVGILWLPAHFFQDHKKKYYGSLFTKCIALMVTVLDMLYPVLTLETLKMLPCTTLYAAPNSCDTRRFMMIDLDIECGRDVRHGMILAIAMPMLWIYVLGIPTFALFQIIYHRNQMDDKKTHIRLNAIMAGFKTNKKWWSVVVMMRKALFITAAIMMKDFGPFIQIFSGAFVICIFTYLHFTNAPYIHVWIGVDEETCEYVETIKSDVLHQMEGGSLMIELITLFCMLVMTDKRMGEIHLFKIWLGIFMCVQNRKMKCSNCVTTNSL